VLGLCLSWFVPTVRVVYPADGAAEGVAAAAAAGAAGAGAAQAAADGAAAQPE